MNFILYSKSDCRFCELAKQLLLDEGHNYEIIMCDNYLKDDREGFLERMETKIGRPYKTFPMIFCEERFIGGYTDLVKEIEKLDCFK